MASSRSIALGVAAGSLAALAAAVVASRPIAQGVDGSAEAKLLELETIALRLDEIRARAMEAPAVAGRATELEERVLDKMKKSEPSSRADLERLGQLEEEIEAAMHGGDAAKMEKLAGELGPVVERLNAAQRAALESDELQDEAEAFGTALLAEMNRIDPETDSLMARATQLSIELASQPR